MVIIITKLWHHMLQYFQPIFSQILSITSYFYGSLQAKIWSCSICFSFIFKIILLYFHLLFSNIGGADKFQPFDQYKIVIDNWELPFSLGRYLVEGTYQQVEPPLQIFSHWKPDGLDGKTFHVYEVSKNDVSSVMNY